MPDLQYAEVFSRRSILAGVLASGVLALPGCATVSQTGYADVVRRLMTASTERAFARLTQPDGFWDSTVARINLPVLFGRPGSVADALLKTSAFREQLQHHLNNIAEAGARRVAPLAAQAIRQISIVDASGLLAGGPTAATTFLRQAIGPGLVNAMIPELDDAMRGAQDPVLNRAVAALTGVNIGDAAKALALEADSAIWYEIGASEAQIRENPAMTGDPVLIGALKKP